MLCSKTLSEEKKKLVYVYKYFAHMIMVLREARRGYQINWGWSYRQLSHQCRCWERNPVPLEDQPVLLTTEPSLQPLILISNFPSFLFNLASWYYRVNYCTHLSVSSV